MLYTTSELSGMVPGSTITSMAFHMYTCDNGAVPVWIWLYETPSTDIDATQSWTALTNNATLVFDGDTVNPTTDTWMQVNFDNTYTYQGGNLVLLVYSTGCTTSGGCAKHGYFTDGFLNTGQAYICPIDGSPNNVNNALSSYSRRYNGRYKSDVRFDYTEGTVSCHSVTGLQISNITTTDADVTWTAPSDAGTYFLQYKLSTQSWESSNVVSQSLTGTTYHLSGLLSNTTYNVRVRNVCSSTDSSYWQLKTFTTPCGDIAALPFMEGFDTYGTGENAYPTCWAKINTYTSANRPYINTTHHNGVGSLYFYTGTSGTYNIAITPMFNASIPVNTLQADFMYRANSTSDRLIAGVMTDPTDATTFVPVDTILPASSPTSWVERSASFANYTGSGQYIAFKNEYTSTSAYAYMDDLSIDLIPSCQRPQYLTTSNITADGCTITWTPAGTETAWEVVVVPANAPVTDGTPETVYSYPHTLTNLNDNTAYDVYVRADCGGGDHSSWSVKATFTTNPLCSSPLDVAISQVTGTSAMVSWHSALFGATGYTVGYSEADQGNWTTQSVTGTSLMLSGLTPNTNYDVFVLSDCDQGEADTVFTTLYTNCLVGGDLAIGNGTSTTSYFPEYCLYNYSYTQQIFLSSEMGGAAEISSIAFEASTIANANRNLQIYLMHTSASSSSSWLDASSAQQVYSGNTTLTTGWNTFLFSTPFQYNGTDNLAVIVVDVTGSWSGTNYFYSHTASGSLSRYVYQDSSPYSTSSTPGSGTSTSTRNNVIFGVPCDSLATCVAPNTYVTDVTENSVTVAWAPGNNETSWEMEYCADGETTWTSEGTVTSPYTVNSLTSDTKYHFRVRSVCGGGDYSEWSTTSARTACTDVFIPYTENFDDAPGTGSGNMVTCWTTGSNYTSTLYPYTSSSQHYSGGYSAYFYGTSAYYSYLASPQFDASVDMTDLQVRFYAYKTSASYYIQVGVMTDPNDPSTFVQVGQNLTPSATNTWEMLEVNTDNYTGTGRYIAFRIPAVSASYMYVDDITVDVIPTCPHVTDIQASSITTTTADVTWTAGGTETDWAVVYGPAGTIGDPENETPVMVNGSPMLDLTNLSPSMGYEVYVKAICSSEGSIWWSGSFNTACGQISELPYTEDFDGIGSGSSAYPNCWYRYNTYSTSTPYPYISSSYHTSGNASLYFYNGTATYSMAVLPPIDVNAHPINTLQVAFKMRSTSSTTSGIQVGVMTDSANVNTFVPVETVHNTVTATFETFEVPLTSYTGTGNYIALKLVNTSGTYSVYLDDLVIELAPLCDKPTNVAFSNITATGADVNWMPGGSETDWELVVVPAGASVLSGTAEPVSSHPYTIDNLNPNTSYDVYVRADCGTGVDFSSWSQVNSFTTTPLCSAPTNVEVTQIAGTSALLTWTPAVFGATGYTIAYTETGMNNWTTQYATNSPYMISGLTPETDYTVTITSECDEGTAPAVTKTFTTTCLYNESAQIGNGTTTTYQLPLNNFYRYSYTQQIFLASELNGPSTINNIAFEYAYTTPSSSKTNVSIYLGHTTKSTFSSASDTVNPANLQLVYTGPLNCQQGWNTFTFTNAFQYNGTDNLVIAIDDNSNGYNGSSYTFYAHNAGATRSLYYYSDSYNMDPANPGGTSASSSTTSNRNNIKITLPCDNTITCIAPNVYVAGSTATSLTLDWAPGNTETSWELEVSDGDTNWVSEGTVTTAPYTVNNLTPGNLYTVRMRSVCGGGEYSSWSMVSGYTECTPIDSVPFVMDFDSHAGSTTTTMAYNNLPYCWSYYNQGTNTTYSGYPIVYTSTSTAASGNNSLRFYTYTPSGTYDDQTAILPAVNVSTLPLNTLQLAFDARALSTSYPFQLVIGVMDNPADMNTFVPVSSITTQTTAYAHYEIPLSQYAGQGAYVAIKAPQPTTNYNYGYVDNITLELLPSCPVPTNVTEVSTTTTSVELSWTENGSATAWLIEYGPAGIAPGEGTTVEATSNPYIVTGLNHSTNYTFYVRSDCGGGDTSSYSIGKVIHTECDVISQLPFTESFDTYGTGDPTYPLCWGKINTYSSNRPYVSTTHYDGVGSLYFYAGSSNTYNIAVTPEFDATLSVNTLHASFMYRGSYATDRMVVGVMTNPTDASTFVAVDTVYPASTPSTWVEREVFFGNYTGSGAYIAFKNEYTSTYCYSYIDSLVVDLMPTCPKPSQLHVTATTNSSATLDWVPNGSEPSWTIAYGTPGFDPEGASASTVTTSTHPFTVDNLASATPYEFYVQANCGGSDDSFWAGPVTATPGSYNMPNTGDNSITTCSVVIYDNGGPNGDYGSNANSTLTIYPETAGNLISIQGTCSIESGWDYLYIYDGAGTSGTLLGTYSGEGLTVPELVSTSGPLTLHFTSDGSVTKSGWALTVACISNTCPAPTNLTVSNIGNTSATVSWTPVGTETSWIVEHKTASATNWTVATATSTSYTLTGLTGLTSYQVRVKADCGDETSPYKTASFTTPNCAASDACAYTFILGDGYGDGWNDGYLTVAQGGTTIATLEAVDHQLSDTQTYDTVTVFLCDNLSTTLNWSAGDYDDEVSVKVLGPDGSQVFYQLDLSTVTGTLHTFTSDCSGAVTNPTVATNAATSIQQTTATLNATVTNPDNMTLTAKGFEWKATTGGTYTQVAGTGTGNSFTADLTGLTPNTSYTFKAFITYNGTTVYGNELTFTTLDQGVEPCNVPTGLTATDVQGESITITWDNDAAVSNWNIQYRPTGGQLSTASSTTNSYTITGLTANTSYQIQVQANCGDGNLSDWSSAITVTTTGIESWLENSVTLYPNPAKEYVDIRVDGDLNVTMMEVYDVYGKLVNTVNVVENPTRINVSSLANGMYFVRVTTEKGVVTKTFVKK